MNTDLDKRAIAEYRERWNEHDLPDKQVKKLMVFAHIRLGLACRDVGDAVAAHFNRLLRR